MCWKINMYRSPPGDFRFFKREAFPLAKSEFDHRRKSMRTCHDRVQPLKFSHKFFANKNVSKFLPKPNLIAPVRSLPGLVTII